MFSYLIVNFYQQLCANKKRTLELLAYFWAKNKVKKYMGYIWVLWCFAIFVLILDTNFSLF